MVTKNLLGPIFWRLQSRYEEASCFDQIPQNNHFVLSTLKGWDALWTMSYLEK